MYGSWEASLDRWLTSPPEHDSLVVGHCSSCGTELYAGDGAWKESDSLYCSTSCCDKDLKERIDEYLPYLDPQIKRMGRFKKYVLRHWEAFRDLLMENVVNEVTLDAPDYWDEAI